MSFARRSAACFVMSSISPPSRPRAATRSACSSTAAALRRRVSSARSPALPGGLRARRRGLAPIRRNPGPGDLVALARFAAVLAPARARRRARPRLEGRRSTRGSRRWIRTPGRPIRAYTPHGGSFNYPAGRHRATALHAGRARAGAAQPTCFLFESAYIAGRFDAQVGVAHRAPAHRRQRARPSGIRAPSRPTPDAADLLYVGELRAAKGIDTLIDALAQRRRASRRRPARGAGRLRARRGAAARAGAASGRRRGASIFAGPLPAREALQLGTGPRGAFARGIAALYRAGGGGRADADGGDRRRRHPRDFRALSRPARTAATIPQDLARAHRWRRSTRRPEQERAGRGARGLRRRPFLDRRRWSTRCWRATARRSHDAARGRSPRALSGLPSSA